MSIKYRALLAGISRVQNPKRLFFFLTGKNGKISNKVAKKYLIKNWRKMEDLNRKIKSIKKGGKRKSALEDKLNSSWDRWSVDKKIKEINRDIIFKKPKDGQRVLVRDSDFNKLTQTLNTPPEVLLKRTRRLKRKLLKKRNDMFIDASKVDLADFDKRYKKIIERAKSTLRDPSFLQDKKKLEIHKRDLRNIRKWNLNIPSKTKTRILLKYRKLLREKPSRIRNRRHLRLL